MDVEDTPAEAAFRAAARAFLDEHAPRRGDPDDFATAYTDGATSEAEYVKRSKHWQATLAAHGWAGVSWPAEYGGRGGTARQAAIFAQEQAAYGVSSGVFTVGIGMAGPTIIAHGTEEQKRRYLTALLRGDEVWCQLFSEPGAGSDLAALSTRAVRDGDEWVVSGQKVWTSGAQHSDLGILLARTDPDRPKHKGITYFLLDMTAPGIEIRPLRQMTGASHFNEVFLTDVRIPDAAVLGPVDGGWAVAMTTLMSERVAIGGGASGPTFADLLALARGCGRAGDPVVRQRLAAAYTRYELLRYLGMRGRVAASLGRAAGPESLVLKLFYAIHLAQLTSTAMAIGGAASLLTGAAAPAGGAWQQQLLSAPSIRIAGGSDEVQRNVLGERVLGLPGEARVDKDVSFRELASGRHGG